MPISKLHRERMVEEGQKSLIDILQRNASVAQQRFIGDCETAKYTWRGGWRSKLKEVYNRKQGYVYLMYFGMGNLYKIGVSNSPISRLGEFIGVLSPFEMQIEHLIECDDPKIIERSLHQFFIKKHLRGEWFALEHNDVELIKSLKGIMIYGEVNYGTEKIPA